MASLLWTLVERSRDEASEHAGERLLAAVGELSAAEQRTVFREWCAAFDAATTEDLRRALFVIEGTGSLDSFADFRSGLILLGQQAYENALADPDSLAEVINEDEGCFVDSFGGRLKQVVSSSLRPSEADWTWSSVPFEDDEEQLAKDFPRLFAKFWDD